MMLKVRQTSQTLTTKRLFFLNHSLITCATREEELRAF